MIELISISEKSLIEPLVENFILFFFLSVSSVFFVSVIFTHPYFGSLAQPAKSTSTTVQELPFS